MNQKELLQRQEALVKAAEAENRELTADEQREFDSLTAQIDALKATPAPAPAPPVRGCPGSPPQSGLRGASESGGPDRCG